MANPQTENGFIKVATDIYEAFARIRISGEARQILDFIIRKTYGYNKKEDAISLSQFLLGTGLKKNTTIRALAKLRVLNLITQKENDIANIYRFNKDFDTWKPLPKKRTYSKKSKVIPQKENNRTPKRDIQYTITKDNITKDTATANAVGDINPIFSLFEKTINPTINYGNTTQRKAIETLIEKVGLQKTISAVKYAISIQTDRYAPTITTPIQLLNKYGELQAYYAKHQKSPKESKHLSL